MFFAVTLCYSCLSCFCRPSRHQRHHLHLPPLSFRSNTTFLINSFLPFEISNTLFITSLFPFQLCISISWPVRLHIDLSHWSTLFYNMTAIVRSVINTRLPDELKGSSFIFIKKSFMLRTWTFVSLFQLKIIPNFTIQLLPVFLHIFPLWLLSIELSPNSIHAYLFFSVGM